MQFFVTLKNELTHNMKNYPRGILRSAVVAAVLLSLTLLIGGSANAAPITGGTGPGGFDLTNGSTSLESWLDASDASTRFTDAGITPAGNGDPVYLWQDKSGNNNNATAIDTTTGRPSYNATALSGNSAIRFDPTGGVGGGADGMVINPSLNIVARPFSVFVVDQYYGGTQGRTLQSSTGGNNWLIGKWATRNGFYANGWVSDPGVVNTAGINNPTIGVGSISTAANSASYFINGVNATNTNSPTGTPGTFGLGAGGTFGTEYSQADVSEIIIYTRLVNTAERQIVENYLSSKYNVGTTTVGVGNRTLGANDFYAGDLNTLGNYDYEVFGVGRVDASNQQLNSGAAGLGIEVSDGSLGNNEWVFAGHNQGDNSIITTGSNAPNTLDQIWSRVWYIDKTENDGVNATLAFDFEDSGLTSPGLAAVGYQLLYSADNDFTDAWTVLGSTTTETDGTVTFNLANPLLLDGYYTLGFTINVAPEPNSLLMMFGVLGCAMLRRRKTMTHSQSN